MFVRNGDIYRRVYAALKLKKNDIVLTAMKTSNIIMLSQVFWRYFVEGGGVSAHYILENTVNQFCMFQWKLIRK